MQICSRRSGHGMAKCKLRSHELALPTACRFEDFPDQSLRLGGVVRANAPTRGVFSRVKLRGAWTVGTLLPS